MLIGSGGNLIDLVLNKIQSTLSVDNENLLTIIYHSLSWNEISVLIFGDNMQSISSKILQVRELNFGSLKENTENKPFYDNVVEKCLMNKELKKSDKNNNYDHFENSHLFVHTNSIFGYDSELLFSEDAKINLKQEINFIVRWDIKPGHLQAFRKDFPLGSAITSGRITSGRADYAISIEDENAFEEYRNIILNSIDKNIRKHIRKVSTVPGFPSIDPDTIGKYFEVKDQFLLHNYLDKYSFSLKQINEVRSVLKRLRFPVTLQDKISRMFVIYNDGIHDPILYGYFIELKQYLTTIYQWIIKSTQKNERKNSKDLIYKSVDSLVNKIKPWVKIFEEAYKNRFGQSYIMNEITDFNLEFTGGIQQLISAYDGAYKSFTSLLGNDSNRSIVYISGEPHIESDKYSVRLNYFHLFQPEFFAAAATHEAANFFTERMSPSNKGASKKEHLNEIIKVYNILNKKLDMKTSSAFDAAAIYFIRDLATLYLAYNRNFELFFYWHWACFLQTGTVYDTWGNIDQKLFNEFITRMFFIDNYINPGNSFFKDQIFPPFTQYSLAIQKVWENAVIMLKPDLEKEFEKHKDYFNKIQGFLSFIILEEIGVSDKTNLSELQSFLSGELTTDYITKNYPEFNNINESHMDYEKLIFLRFEQVEKLSNVLYEAFENASIYNIDNFLKHPGLPKEVLPSFCYHLLFFSYLKHTKEKIAANSWSLLIRDIDSGQIIKNAYPTKLRIDPFGGIFSADVETRKSLLQARAIFLKTMWDFSMQIKSNQFF